MHKANLDSADLFFSDLRFSFFDGASLRGTNLTLVKANPASFRSADLSGALLVGAVFEIATLTNAELVGSDLRLATLESADLASANMKSANLMGVDLRRTRLTNLRNWREIYGLRFANVYGVVDAPPGFVEWATDTMGAVSIPSSGEWFNVLVEKADVILREEITGRGEPNTATRRAIVRTALRRRDVVDWYSAF